MKINRSIIVSLSLMGLVFVQACGDNTPPVPVTPQAVTPPPPPPPPPAQTVNVTNPSANGQYSYDQIVNQYQNMFGNFKLNSRIDVHRRRDDVTVYTIPDGTYTWSQMYVALQSIATSCACNVPNLPSGVTLSPWAMLDYYSFNDFLSPSMYTTFWETNVFLVNGGTMSFYEVYNYLVGYSYSYYSNYYYPYVFAQTYPTYYYPTNLPWPNLPYYGNSVYGGFKYNDNGGISIGIGASIHWH